MGGSVCKPGVATHVLTSEAPETPGADPLSAFPQGPPLQHLDLGLLASSAESVKFCCVSLQAVALRHVAWEPNPLSRGSQSKDEGYSFEVGVLSTSVSLWGGRVWQGGRPLEHKQPQGASGHAVCRGQEGGGQGQPRSWGQVRPCKERGLSLKFRLLSQVRTSLLLQEASALLAGRRQTRHGQEREAPRHRGARPCGWVGATLTSRQACAQPLEFCGGRNLDQSEGTVTGAHRSCVPPPSRRLRAPAHLVPPAPAPGGASVKDMRLKMLVAFPGPPPPPAEGALRLWRQNPAHPSSPEIPRDPEVSV